MKKLHFNRPTSIGEIPTIYLDSLTYLEQLTRVVKYLQDEVVPMLETMKQDIENQNDNIENAINDINTNLQDFENKIQNYIDTTNASLEAYKNTLTSEWNAYKEDTTNNYNTFTTNITNAFNEFKTSTTDALNTFKTEMQDEYASFINTVNSTINNFNTELTRIAGEVDKYAGSINDAVLKVDNAITMFENLTNDIPNINNVLDKLYTTQQLEPNIMYGGGYLKQNLSTIINRELLKNWFTEVAGSGSGIGAGLFYIHPEGDTTNNYFVRLNTLNPNNDQTGANAIATFELQLNNLTPHFPNLTIFSYNFMTEEIIINKEIIPLTVLNTNEISITPSSFSQGTYGTQIFNCFMGMFLDIVRMQQINNITQDLSSINNYLNNGISNTDIQEASAGMNIVGKYLNINTNYIKDNFDTLKTKVTSAYKPIIFNDDTYISIGINNHRPNGDTGNDYINIGISNSTNNNIMIPSLGGASGCLITIDKTGAIVETIPLGDNPINFSNPVPLWAGSIKTYTPNYHSASGDTDFYVGGIFSIVTLDKKYIESKMIQLSQLMFRVNDLAQAVVQNQEQTETDINNLQTNINENRNLIGLNTSSINNLTQKAETNEANINTLLGQFTVAESSITASITNPINYPEGYNQTNTVIAGVMLRRNGTNVWDWTNHDVAKMIIATGSNNINAEVYNTDGFRYDRIRLLLYK